MSGGLALCLAWQCSGSPEVGPPREGQAWGNESLSNQKAILRLFPSRTSIEVPRIVRRLSQGAA